MPNAHLEQVRDCPTAAPAGHCHLCQRVCKVGRCIPDFHLLPLCNPWFGQSSVLARFFGCWLWSRLWPCFMSYAWPAFLFPSSVCLWDRFNAWQACTTHFVGGQDAALISVLLPITDAR